MPTFDEVQFPTDISYGSRGGPEFMTDIVILDSGHEQRNINWALSRAKYDVSYGIRTNENLADLTKFFYARQGRAYGFRYKDWADFTATQEPLTQTGSKFVQLVKKYTSGSRTYIRNITKPVASPAVTMRRGGGAFSAFTLDTTTGIATLTPDSSKAITNITKANPGVVTATAHGFTTGDEIWIDSVGGMTQVNKTLTTDTPYTIIVLTPDTFSIGVNTTSYSTYTSGGFARKFVQNTETLDWTGQFDVPVRFDVDHLPASFDDFGIGTADGIILLEVRVGT